MKMKVEVVERLRQPIFPYQTTPDNVIGFASWKGFWPEADKKTYLAGQVYYTMSITLSPAILFSCETAHKMQ